MKLNLKPKYYQYSMSQLTKCSEIMNDKKNKKSSLSGRLKPLKAINQRNFKYKI